MSNRIQGTTRFLGLIGNPISHSRSPHMHNSAFDKTGLDYVYLCMEKSEGTFNQTLNALKELNCVGGNITFPHKQVALDFLDEVSEDARIIGAVNTYKIDDETKKVSGYNTDGRGFIASIEELEIPYKGNKVTLVGVGGAGRAIAINLALKGVKELVIKDLIQENVDEIIKAINENYPDVLVRFIDSDDELKEEIKDSVLLINATNLGMKPHEDKSIIPDLSYFNPDCFVYDIVYEPRQTKLLKMAEEAGCKWSNGINMMIWQGAIAFNIWTGEEMPQEYVRKELFEEK